MGVPQDHVVTGLLFSWVSRSSVSMSALLTETVEYRNCRVAARDGRHASADGSTDGIVFRIETAAGMTRRESRFMGSFAGEGAKADGVETAGAALANGAAEGTAAQTDTPTMEATVPDEEGEFVVDAWLTASFR